VPKPATDLERYLAGEFAEEQEFPIPAEDEREAKPGESPDMCLLRRVLAPFARKGS
jgi:hypothetical protein